MTILLKTLADYQLALGFGIGPSQTQTFNMVYQQIDVPTAALYCIVSSRADGHLEVWKVTA